MNDHLSKIWWLGVPLVLIAIQAVLELTLTSQVLSPLHSENGPHETLQALIMAAAFVLSLIILLRMKRREQPWLTAWIGLAALCCFYVAGEEISWGQHIANWATPDFWNAVNDQGETNLHNTSSWLDQKPRLILLIGVVTGGLILPALRHFKPGVLPQRFAVIYPPATLGVTAFMALAVNLLDKLDEALKEIVIFQRASEVEELYLFYFVLLYLVILRRRILIA